MQVRRVDRVPLGPQERDEPSAADEEHVEEVERPDGVFAWVEGARELVSHGGREAVHLD